MATRQSPRRRVCARRSRAPAPSTARAARIAGVSETPTTSVLSDGTIMRLVREGRIKIDPWDETLVQPASVDLRLGDSFRVFHNYRVTSIDLSDPPRGLTEEVKVEDEEPFVIHPGEFADRKSVV